MGYDFNSDREVRYEKISERIRDFVNSSSKTLEIQLYKDEIPKLEEEISEILITRGRSCKGEKGKHWCTIFRKRIVE